MTTPSDDWQERIEKGLPFDSTTPYPTTPSPSTPDPTAGYPTPDNPTEAYPTPDDPHWYPDLPPAQGPVYGAPGSGPAYGAPGYPTSDPEGARAGHPPFGFELGEPPQYGQAPQYGQPRYGQAPQYGVPGYGFASVDPVAPYGRDPLTGEPLSDKSRTTGGLLQLLLPFLGICGVGRLYVGSTTIGLIQLLGMFVAMFMSLLLIGIPFMIAFWLWSVIDGILMLVGNVRDGQGRKLRS
ncbi:TM2 domain-containing protein [Rhodococcus sp. NPDC003318]|uniref:TM2 domain-containing protein n=1 Tax=Rhodococcus sp. NPDC003318 TaxID=3364503 RepID=UPI0036ABF53D